MKFELGANILEFEQGADYPASRPVEKVQGQERMASGALDVEQLGPDISKRILDFGDMSETDYLGLRNWFINVANGAINSFTFTDEKGFAGIVRITTKIYDFPESYFDGHTGSMTLEYV